MVLTTDLGLFNVSLYSSMSTGDWDLFLAARPVPWNGRGRRQVELTKGCYSGVNSQGYPGVL